MSNVGKLILIVMERAAEKNQIIEKLQQQILSIQGFRTPLEQAVPMGLGALETAFPNNIFPTGAIHEFLSTASHEAAATVGFMSGLVGKLMSGGGTCLWISTRRTIFPPALRIFGIAPERVIFIDLAKEKDVLWIIEEALKCEALSAVVGELSEISFTQSRRLQLAVEQSRVTGLMHCYNPGKITSTTSVARWRIKSIASEIRTGMPGLGHPRWQVELLKIRNGKPGSWQLRWAEGKFCYERMQAAVPNIQTGKTA